MQWRDIVMYMREGGVRHITDQNSLYDPLHFVLPFVRGEPGWEAGIPHVNRHQDLSPMMIDDEATESSSEQHRHTQVHACMHAS